MGTPRAFAFEEPAALNDPSFPAVSLAAFRAIKWRFLNGCSAAASGELGVFSLPKSRQTSLLLTKSTVAVLGARRAPDATTTDKRRPLQDISISLQMSRDYSLEEIFHTVCVLCSLRGRKCLRRGTLDFINIALVSVAQACPAVLVYAAVALSALERALYQILNSRNQAFAQM